MDKTKAAGYIYTNPVKFQVAKDNKYEEVWVIDLVNVLPSREEIQEYLQREPYRDIAIEIIWEQSEGSYVLTVFHNSNIKLQSEEDFIYSTLMILKDKPGFVGIIDKINSEVIGSDYLFSQELDLLRVGIFNHWFSTGPVDIWHKGEPREMTLEQLKAKFKGYENLLSTSLNFQALYLAYSYGPDAEAPAVKHGFKVPSTRKISGAENTSDKIDKTDKIYQTHHEMASITWELDFELMLKYLKELEGFNFS